MSAYFIVQGTVTDEPQFQKYRDAVVPFIAKFGGKFAAIRRDDRVFQRDDPGWNAGPGFDVAVVERHIVQRVDLQHRVRWHQRRGSVRGRGDERGRDQRGDRIGTNRSRGPRRVRRRTAEHRR